MMSSTKSNAALLPKANTAEAKAKPCRGSTNVNHPHNNTVPTKEKPKTQQTNRRRPRQYKTRGPHFNSLWSIWYGLAGTALQLYLVVRSVKRFLIYVSLPWPEDQKPYFELNVFVVLVSTSLVLLPFFLASTILKIGNLANDGFKLGAELNLCSSDPEVRVKKRVLMRRENLFRALWRHGAPTAPLLHLVSAFCLLVPRILVEAQLIRNKFLPVESIWRTDLDFLVPSRDRQVVLSYVATSSNASPTPPEVLRAMSFVPDEPDPVSPEFLNYALALLVFAVRYPAVFWRSGKGFGALFSAQLVANGVQGLLTFGAVSILYKIQLNDPEVILPRYQPFFMSARVLLVVYTIIGALVMASSTILYFYGFNRFQSFLERSREAQVVTSLHLRHHAASRAYLPHCLALMLLLALAACVGPLLYDFTVVYRGSLDCAVLAGGIGTILHLFFWVALWLLLTIKRRWHFKLMVSVGKASVRNSSGVRVVGEVELKQRRGDDDSPLLVVGKGHAFAITETGPQRAILSAAQRATTEQRKTNTEEEQIYWLRPKPPSPKDSPDSDRAWMKKGKAKVTFDETLTSSPRLPRSAMKSPRAGRRSQRVVDVDGMDLSGSEDDGDYATLRDLPMMRRQQMEHNITEDTAAEDNGLLNSLPSEPMSFAHAATAAMHCNSNYEDLRHLVSSTPLPQQSYVTPIMVHNKLGNELQPSPVSQSLHHSTDSGLPGDDRAPRSDSTSTGSGGSSNSPPASGIAGGAQSDTSSGVHSTNSDDVDNSQIHRMSTSVDDLTLPPPPMSLLIHRPNHWKSFSLQRNTPPPMAASQMWPTYGSLPPPICSEPPDATVVIRRKAGRPKTADLTPTSEPFERTNMRMTSFTDQPDFHSPNHRPNLPLRSSSSAGCRGTYPRHTTIPNTTRNVIYANQRPTGKTIGIVGPNSGNLTHETSFNRPAGLHRTVPMAKATMDVLGDERDSANYSIGSSGDSDSHFSHP